MTRLRFFCLAALGMALPLGAFAAPVQVALKPQAVVSADNAGFFTLGAVADLSGGDAACRKRLESVCVGRAPLPGEVRHLTPGDILLKMRQAGCRPEREAMLAGATDVAVTVASSAPFTPSTPSLPPAPTDRGTGVGAGGPCLVHRSDAVTIVVHDSGLCITAKGQAREDGRAGDLIHVHREGVMTDLMATVLDAQTVQMEM